MNNSSFLIKRGKNGIGRSNAKNRETAGYINTSRKSTVIAVVARDIGDNFPGIENTPGVCGDEPCIVRTRIPVGVLVRARELGKNDADILNAFPTLRAEDLANAWAYARSHKKEIDAQIQENEAA